MSNAIQTKREIARKRARVAHLTEFINENQLLAFQNVEAGFFAAAEAMFLEIGRSCGELHTLCQDIQQLNFDLERIEAEQTELSLSPAPTAA
jgi:hypothetical protein